MQPQPHFSSFKGIKRILIVKLKHIGDVLLATPCIRALYEAFPDARISALVNDESASILVNHPLLEEVLAFPRGNLRSRPASRIASELSFLGRVRRCSFDMVVDLTSGDRAAWLTRLSGARYRVAYDPHGKGFLGKRFLYNLLAPFPFDPDLHHVQKDLGLLEHFGIMASRPRLELYPTEEDVTAADRAISGLGLKNGDSFIVAHPTSRWLFKCWADERFAALVDWLQNVHGFSVILTCGPNERELGRVRHVLEFCSSKPHVLFGELGLTQWAALVKKARLFVGVDSAPMHIAASQGTPTLAFFGPTGFQNWRPWAVQHAVLVRDCPCSRGRRLDCDWTRTRACMTAITLEEAQTAVSDLLKQPHSRS